jgi:integrase
VLDALARRAGERGEARVFDFSRYWVLDQVKRLCQKAGVKEVTTHGMRGLHATLATAAGATSELVAAQLGHTTPAITERHYTDPAALEAAASDRVLDALKVRPGEGDKAPWSEAPRERSLLH